MCELDLVQRIVSAKWLGRLSFAGCVVQPSGQYRELLPAEVISLQPAICVSDTRFRRVSDT